MGNKIEQAIIEDAINHYFHSISNRLCNGDLGDIERANLEIAKEELRKILLKTNECPTGELGATDDDTRPELPANAFNWVSIFLKKPNEGQKVASRIANQAGYVGECVYVNGYFETYRDCGNRIEITRWKNDEWAALL